MHRSVELAVVEVHFSQIGGVGSECHRIGRDGSVACDLWSEEGAADAVGDGRANPEWMECSLYVERVGCALQQNERWVVWSI